MTEALFVLNPRCIPNCINAINALGIPTCWISYMPEAHAAKSINQQVRKTGYDRYLILSDDTVPTRATLDLILHAGDTNPCVTGYCNLDETEHRDIINLTQNTLPPPPPQAASYQFLTRTQAEHQHGNLIPTTFAGLSLTLLTRELLLHHPLHVSAHGGQMDYMLSHSLQTKGVPIVAPNGAYVHHVKERWNHTDTHPTKQLLIGKRAPTITWTNLQAKAA